MFMDMSVRAPFVVAAVDFVVTELVSLADTAHSPRQMVAPAGRDS